MKKSFLILLAFLFLSGIAYSETTVSESPAVTPDSSPALSAAAEAAPEPSPTVAAVDTVAPAVVPAATESAAPVVVATPAAVASPASVEGAAPKEGMASENLEFVSGEVGSIDEAAKSVTVKLYGETENTTSDKTLSVKVDESTDITDGEKDRDLKSLTAGTEVDVEYDPATNKATYIFVY